MTLAEGYEIEVHNSPLPEATRQSLASFLEHKGRPWEQDIRARMEGAGGNLFACCFNAAGGGELAAHTWIGHDSRNPDLGLLGHVFTDKSHRKRGLATEVLNAAMSAFDELGGRWIILGVSNPAAARIYERLGFGGLAGSLEVGHWTMIRTEENLPATLEEYYAPAETYEVEALSPLTYPGAALLFNSDPTENKLHAMGIDLGLSAEERLLVAMEKCAEGAAECNVALHPETKHVHALRYREGAESGVYGYPTCPEATTALRKP